MLGGDEALLRARKVVITGLVPVIHVLFGMRGTKDVDARHKAGHDEPRLTGKSAILCPPPFPKIFVFLSKANHFISHAVSSH
jgi:hypothetical protein